LLRDSSGGLTPSIGKIIARGNVLCPALDKRIRHSGVDPSRGKGGSGLSITILTRNPKLIGAIWHNLLAASAIRQAAPYLLIRRRLPQGISAQHLAPSHPLQHRNSG
jgi:hypothetical protein